MSIETLDSGVELQRLATVLSRALNQPGKESLAVTLRSAGRIGHEIVYVQYSTTDKILDQPEARDRTHLTSLLEVHQSVSIDL